MVRKINRKTNRDYDLQNPNARYGTQGFFSTNEFMKYRTHIRSGVRTTLESDPDVVKRKEEKLQELQDKRASGEVGQDDFDFGYLLYLKDNDCPLRKSDMLNKAVVLRWEDLNELNVFSFIHTSGEEMSIETESLHPDDVLILYPDEVG